MGPGGRGRSGHGVDLFRPGAFDAVDHGPDPVVVGVAGREVGVGMGFRPRGQVAADAFPAGLARGPNDKLVAVGAGHFTPAQIDAVGRGVCDQAGHESGAGNDAGRIRPDALGAVDDGGDAVVVGLPGGQAGVGVGGGIAGKGIADADPGVLGVGPDDEDVAAGAGDGGPAQIDLADGGARGQNRRGWRRGNTADRFGPGALDAVDHGADAIVVGPSGDETGVGVGGGGAGKGIADAFPGGLAVGPGDEAVAFGVGDRGPVELDLAGVGGGGEGGRGGADGDFAHGIGVFALLLVDHGPDAVVVGVELGKPGVGIGGGCAGDGVADAFPAFEAVGPHDQLVAVGAGHACPAEFDAAGGGRGAQRRDVGNGGFNFGGPVAQFAGSGRGAAGVGVCIPRGEAGMGKGGHVVCEGAVIEPHPGVVALAAPDLVGGGAHDGRPADGDAVGAGGCDENGRGKSDGILSGLGGGLACAWLGEGDVKPAGRAREIEGREDGGQDKRSECEQSYGEFHSGYT